MAKSCFCKQINSKWRTFWTKPVMAPFCCKNNKEEVRGMKWKKKKTQQIIYIFSVQTQKIGIFLFFVGKKNKAIITCGESLWTAFFQGLLRLPFTTISHSFFFSVDFVPHIKFQHKAKSFFLQANQLELKEVQAITCFWRILWTKATFGTKTYSLFFTPVSFAHLAKWNGRKN